MGSKSGKMQSVRIRYVSCKTAANEKKAASDGKGGDGLVEVVGGAREREERDGARQAQELEQRRRAVTVRSEGEVVGGYGWHGTDGEWRGECSE